MSCRALQITGTTGALLITLIVSGCVQRSVSPTEGLLFKTQDLAGSPVEGHVGGRVAVDARKYDDRNSRDSEFRLDVAEIRADASHASGLHARLIGDLVGIDSRFGFKELWVGQEFHSALRIRGGLIPVAIGLESSVDESRLSFIGYAFPGYLDRQQDWGVAVDGEYRDGFFEYRVTGTAGEGFDLNGERRHNPQVSARVQTYLFRGLEPLDGLFFGGGVLYGFDYNGQLDVATPFRNKVFQVPRLEGDASQYLNLGYGLDLGSLRVWHEWTKGGIRGVETPAGGEENFSEQVTAWSAGFAWFVTGEVRSQRLFRREPERLQPLRPVVGERDTGWGAWEIAARYSNADIDRSFFDLGFTRFDQSSQEFRTFTAALNWYPTRNLRVATQFVRTIADQFPAVFDSHGRDTSFLVRLEWSF